MSEAVVRAATLLDVPTIVRFNQALAEETEGKHIDGATLTRGVRAMLDDPALGRYFIAETDRDAVGQIMLTSEWSDWRNGHFWWIQSVYVESSARGHGVFRGLYRHVETLAREADRVIGLRLYVENDNSRAISVYEALGMQPTGYRLMETEF